MAKGKNLKREEPLRPLYPGREFLYGRNPVLEALKAKRRKFYRLILAEGIKDSPPVNEIISLGNRYGLYPIFMSRERLDSAIPDGSHQGVILEVSSYPYSSFEEILQGSSGVMLALDLLQDPQNMGTLLRTAEATGIDGVLIQERNTVGVTPAVVKASAGAVEHLKVVQVSNLNRALEKLKEQGYWIIGLEALPEAKDLFEIQPLFPMVLVVGSEGKGLRPSIKEKCDLFLKLPMEGKVSSLNAAVAGSIALYWFYRFRRRKEAS